MIDAAEQRPARAAFIRVVDGKSEFISRQGEGLALDTEITLGSFAKPMAAVCALARSGKECLAQPLDVPPNHLGEVPTVRDGLSHTSGLSSQVGEDPTWIHAEWLGPGALYSYSDVAFDRSLRCIAGETGFSDVGLWPRSLPIRVQGLFDFQERVVCSTTHERSHWVVSDIPAGLKARAGSPFFSLRTSSGDLFQHGGGTNGSAVLFAYIPAQATAVLCCALIDTPEERHWLASKLTATLAERGVVLDADLHFRTRSLLGEMTFQHGDELLQVRSSRSDKFTIITGGQAVECAWTVGSGFLPIDEHESRDWTYSDYFIFGEHDTPSVINVGERAFVEKRAVS